MNDPGIVRDDVIEIPRMLQRADDRVPSALQNSNHATFGSLTRARAASFYASRRQIAANTNNHAVAVHGSAGVLSGDKDVRLALFLRNQKAITGLMDRQFSGDEIGFGGKNVTVLANPDDFAGVFKLAQNPPDLDLLLAFQPERAGDLIPVAGLIIGSAQQADNLFSNCATVFAHFGETILGD